MAPSAKHGPLDLLRHHTMEKHKVSIEGDNIFFSFAKKAIPKKTLTQFVSRSSQKPYDLLAVYVCLTYQDLSFGDYVSKCRSMKATMVSTVDKKELIKYLTGKIKTSSQIKGESATAPSTTTVTSTTPSTAATKRKADKKEPKSSKKSRASGESTEKDSTSSGRVLGDQKTEQMLEALACREINQDTRITVLRSKNKDFGSVLSLLKNHITLTEHLKKSGGSKSRSSRNNVPLKESLKQLGGAPIIVVPAGMKDVLTLMNVKEFLVSEKYCTVAEAKSAGGKKPRSLKIEIERNSEKYQFEIVESVSRFREREWKRVVAVLVSGQVWQFKGWKWDFPVEVFTKVVGVYVNMQGSEEKPVTNSWNIKRLKIHPSKRHLDKAASRQFWDILFTFLKSKFN